MNTFAAQQDRGLFDRLFASHHLLLVRFLTRMTRCPQRAEDLAQTAWVKLLSARDRGACTARDESELRAYLFAVARNTFLDECTRKHEAVRTRPVDPAQLDQLVEESHGAPGPEEELGRLQVSGILRQAMDLLPAEQRVVLHLWSRGTSIKEMAAATRAPVDTVLSRKKYGFARMRVELAGVAHALC